MASACPFPSTTRYLHLPSLFGTMETVRDAGVAKLTCWACRRTSQKPTDELYAAFKQNFPSFASINAAATSSAAPAHGTTAVVSEAPNAALNPRSVALLILRFKSFQCTCNSFSQQLSPEFYPSLAIMLTCLEYYSQFEAQNDLKEQALTPHGTNDLWRFTPSLFDHNPSFSMGTFTAAPGYYTPTSGGLNTIYHNPAAGDLHTPSLPFQLGTPLSMPVPDATSFENMQGFNPQLFQTPQYSTNSGFPNQQADYPQSMLIHQDSGYGPMESSPDNDADLSAGITAYDRLATAVARRSEGNAALALPLSHEKSVNYSSIERRIC